METHAGALILSACLLILSVLFAFFCQSGLRPKLTKALAAWSAAFSGATLTYLGTYALHHAPWTAVTLPVYIDATSGVFLILLGCVETMATIFAISYKIKPLAYFVLQAFFIAGMAGVLIAGNTIVFIVSFETMSIASAGLVASDHEHRKNLKNLLIYVGATRIAGALVAFSFLLQYAATSEYRLPYLNSANIAMIGNGQTIALVSLVTLLLGLAIKAGVYPFHLWLPYAHPQAPAPASALMSGVMVSIALYPIARCTWHFGHLPIFYVIAIVLGVLGLLSAFWGALQSFVQSDLKRMLAYSTVENVGLMLVSLSLCACAMHHGMHDLAVRAFFAFIMLCAAHAVFKSLLFMGAGALHLHDAPKPGDRPYLLSGMLGAALSASSLPGTLGFYGKWCLMTATMTLALEMLGRERIVCGVALLSLGVFAMVGALAMASAIKAFAIYFCPSSENVRTDKVFIADLVIGLGGLICIAGNQPWWACILLAIMACLALPIWRGGRCSEPGSIKHVWNCGGPAPSAAMRASAQSLSHSVTTIFAPIIKYNEEIEIAGDDRRHFVQRLVHRDNFTSLIEAWCYKPLVTLIAMMSTGIVKMQAGSVHRYLLYCLVCVTLLMVATRCR